MELNYLGHCRVPYLALARTLEAVEGVSARLKIIEILANYFRSVIILSPEDLLPSVYLCLNKLAPAYEGIFFVCSLFLWCSHN
jgi:DNA ligase-1